MEVLITAGAFDPTELARSGQALCRAGRRLEGVEQLRRAAGAWLSPPLAPDRIDGALDVIGQLQHWSDFEGALRFGRQAAATCPAHARTHQLLAVTCGQINLTDEALAAGETALALAPDHGMMQVLQASLEADAGRFEAAERRLVDLLRRAPPDREAFRAHKEMARIVDGLGRYHEVFPHLEAAGDVAARLPEWRTQPAALIPRVIRSNFGAYSRESLGRWAGSDFPGPRPVHVFVVGFFRSGTTLIQEILDSQARVFVADEADLVWEAQRALHRLDRSADPTAAKLARLDHASVAQLRDSYWTAAHGLYGAAADAPVFVDKFTMNTLDLGLINTLFPDAKVIFAMRDPRDVCLSSHMQLMTPSPATANLLTWRGTASFYAETMRWWLHIREQLTVPVLEVRYEDVVGDFEAACRRLFGFLGLAWRPDVAEFHARAKGKFIASPSRNQVSKPLHAGSMARWRHFTARCHTIADLTAPMIGRLGYPAS